ncbi:MAG: DUF927 domain-containing protein [Sandaracinaceae bacterium]|nr:DUF927 domain-containing protein [Sandaracinaceae bacterium]
MRSHLDHGLESFVLPRVSRDPGTAVELLLTLREVASAEVAVVLLTAIAAAPLCEVAAPPFSLALFGATGARKTSLAAVAQSCFGSFGYSSLAASFESTANAIALTLCLAKDALVVVDDLLRDPHGNRMAAANQLIRSQANRAARQRLKSDGSEGISYPPRGLMLFTAEQRPDSGAEQCCAGLVCTSASRSGQPRGADAAPTRVGAPSARAAGLHPVHSR